MKFLYFPVVLFFLIPLFSRPAPVDSSIARTVALNFLSQGRNDKQFTSRGELLEMPQSWLDKTNKQYYFFRHTPTNSFIIISGDDAATPVLGYSSASLNKHDNKFQSEIPPALEDLLKQYARQIDTIRQLKIRADSKTTGKWLSYINSDSKTNGPKAIVEPLLVCTWNQGAGYNALCPEDPAGPAGRVYAGCVATAMAMTMYYYRFPDEGTGSHGYYSNYGYLNVNFAESMYNFSQMPTYISSGASYDIAKLQYDCGVSVDMMYSPSGSGAFMENAANAMKTYFKYNPGLRLEYRNGYSDADWCNLLKSQIDAGQPVPYAGFDESAGHAFVCDGYDSGDFFHFNWGWSGSYNGYFHINNLNPGYNFNWGHQSIIDAYPANIIYPKDCSNDTMTSPSGSIVAGMAKGNYLNNQSCSWKIIPQDSVSSIRLVFQYLDTQAGHDTITIYEGENENGTFIASYSGNTIPPAINVASSKVFVTFKSDASVSKRGFVLDYFATPAIFCQSLTLLNDTNGMITDGSGMYKYHPNALCRWKINTPGAQGYIINFSEFDLESNTDFVKIYNSESSGLTELMSYSGSNIPVEEYFPYPTLLVLFKSNNLIENNGFTLHFQSLFTGIEDETTFNTNFSISSGSELHVMTLTNLPQEHFELRIFDVNGRIVYKSDFMVDASVFRQTLELSKLEAGSYFARIFSRENTFNTKFITY